MSRYRQSVDLSPAGERSVLELILAETGVELRAAQAEKASRLRLVPLGLPQRVSHELAVESGEIQAVRREDGLRRGGAVAVRRRREAGAGRGKVLAGDETSVAEKERSLDRVPELAWRIDVRVEGGPS